MKLKEKIKEILLGKEPLTICPYCGFKSKYQNHKAQSMATHLRRAHPDKWVGRAEQIEALFNKELDKVIKNVKENQLRDRELWKKANL